MEVILTEKIRSLGGLGEKVNVKPGYARNYLIPKGMAVPYSDEKMKEFEAHRAEFEKAEKEALAKAQERAKSLGENPSITLTAKAMDEGKLYGSLGTREITEALAEAGHTVEKAEVILPHGSVIREVGEYDVPLEFHSDVEVILKVTVTVEE